MAQQVIFLFKKKPYSALNTVVDYLVMDYTPIQSVTELCLRKRVLAELLLQSAVSMLPGHTPAGVSDTPSGGRGHVVEAEVSLEGSYILIAVKAPQPRYPHKCVKLKPLI